MTRRKYLIAAMLLAALTTLVLVYLATTRKATTVDSVVNWHGVLMPFPKAWQPYKSRSGRLIIRFSGYEERVWVSFEKPRPGQEARQLASSFLTGKATVYSSPNLYGRMRWLQTTASGGQWHMRGVISSSKGPIILRARIDADVPSSGERRIDVDKIIGWVDAPPDTLPRGIRIIHAIPQTPSRG
jgi:hypothetical protein